MTTPTVAPPISDPCQPTMEKYMECVKSHPGGLKENDCEDEKIVFRQCMKDWKNKVRGNAS